MKLICLVKFVPDVDNFKYDYENNILIRENVRLLINPDDACAVAFALRVKARHPETYVEVVTMAPSSVKPYMEDILRMGADRAVIISDKLYAGSDTYATSMILSGYLSSQEYDMILTGTQAIDGDTSHIPSQIAEYLGISQMSGIVKIDEEKSSMDSIGFDVDSDTELTTYEMALPAIASLTRESKYKLPYIRHSDMQKDVSDRMDIITNGELNFKDEEIGLKGSKTRVVKTYTKEFEKKDKTVVKVDEKGIDFVYEFLKNKGFI